MFKVNLLKKMNIVSGFGYRVHPILGIIKFHTGIDLEAPMKTPTFAKDDGVIVVSKANRGSPKTGYGWYTVLQCADYCVVYAHLLELHRKSGENVKAGELIGYTGSSGEVTGPHLHLEVRLGKYDIRFWDRDGKGNYISAVDPYGYINPVPEWKKEFDEAWEWAKEIGINDGEGRENYVTEEQLMVFLVRFYTFIHSANNVHKK